MPQLFFTFVPLIKKTFFMMKKIMILSVCILASSIYAQLSKEVQSFSINGRSYDVTTPSDYDPNKEYPIVFELHSFLQNKTQMNDQNIVNQQQYISVRPEGTDILLGRVWNTWSETNAITRKSNDVAHITAVYNDIKQKIGAQFNAEKVYVYGYSNGGAMAMKMIQETKLFKAAIIRSMSFANGHTIPSTASKIPIIFVHATGDETIPYQGGEGKYSGVAPNFESIKTTVSKWATHYGLSQPVEIKYLKGSSASSKNDFYFREYSHSTYPIYFFVIDGGQHFTKDQFSDPNIKRALIRLAKNPKQYGIYRQR